jgi:flagellin-like hook-associated protein FlgL
MSGVYPIPVGRSSGLLLQQRLTHQLQSDQQELLRLTSQLSSGRRILAPSDDTPAGLRGVSLQRILEQKEQVRVNLNTSRSYLAASETAIAKVADLLNDVRGAAVQGADSTTSDTQRAAIAQEVQAALAQLLDVGNQQFRDRYLFAGSNTTQRPYEVRDGQVVYLGNENELRSYADLDQLFSSSIAGVSVLGGLSAEVKGAATLTPVLSETTRLADLHGGAGFIPGSLVVSDGATSRTIDLTGAQTLGDVARRIEANPPENRRVIVRFAPEGLNITLDADGGGTLSIRESGGGKTAFSLGILAPENTGLSVQGEPLTPKLRLTTSLDDLLGARSSARLEFPGADNDITLEAKANGAASNGVTIQLVNDDLLQAAPGLAAGNETVTYSDTAIAARAALPLSGANNDLLISATAAGTALNNVRITLQRTAGLGNSANAVYDAASKTLTIQVDDANQTTLGALAAAVDGTGLFTVSGDNSNGETLDLNATVIAADAGVITGNTGNSGGEARTIFVHVKKNQTTAANVVAALQADAAVAAEFDIRLDGKDAASAEGAGLVTLETSAVTGGGSGEAFDRDAGLRVVVGDAIHVINFTEARTVEDLLNTLNGSAAGLLAQINARGDGIDIRTRVSGANFQIGENGGVTASQLGVRTFTRDTTLVSLNHGRGVHTAEGTDLVVRRSDGVELEIDLTGAVTIGDVLDRINTHPDNQDPLTAVTARLPAVGNGIELVDANPVVDQPLTVLRTTLSEAALDLGFLSAGQTEAVADAGSNVLAGGDVNPHEAAGAFNSLARLTDALLTNDLREIVRAVGLIEQDLERVVFSRGDLGARQRSMEILEFRHQDEEVELRRTLSEEIDADLVKTISDLTARQTSLEASMRQAANTLRTSLLDFL